jgi:hypothetical protein
MTRAAKLARSGSAHLRGEKLASARPGPTRRGIEAGVVQGLPHGGGGDVMAEPDQCGRSQAVRASAAHNNVLPSASAEF